MLSLESRHEVISKILLQLQGQEPTLPGQTEVFLPADWALAIEATPSQLRIQLWHMMPEDMRAPTLPLIREEYRVELLKSLEQSELINATAAVASEQAVNVLGQLKSKDAAEVIAGIEDETQTSTIQAAMEYGDEQIGRYATRELLTFDDAVDVTECKLKLAEASMKHQHFVYFTDKKGRYVGRVSPMSILNCGEDDGISSLILAEEDYIRADDSIDNLSEHFKRLNCDELPVLDDNRRIIGLFHAKDVLSFVEEFYEEKLAHVGNVSDEDLFAPVAKSARQRAVWLGINLLTALLAAWVIGMFEATLDKVVALAVLMPIVASMGGIAGSQSLTLTIRGLATNQLSDANISLLRNKEFMVVAINSVIWAVAVAVIAMAWFNQGLLALILGFAVIVNMIVAVLSGIAIPYIMHKMKIDPALAGSVVLTTVSDVVGFFVFLGLASLFLL